MIRYIVLKERGKEVKFSIKKIEVKSKDLNNRQEKIVTDPFGSYTGRPLDETEKPIQDADDL